MKTCFTMNRFFASSTTKIFSQLSFHRGIIKYRNDSTIMDVSRHSWKHDTLSFQAPTSFVKRMSSSVADPNDSHPKKPFSLILRKQSYSRSCASWTTHQEDFLNIKSPYIIFRPGILLLKGYLSISEQVEIVNKCEELGVGPGGFYEPYPKVGGKLRRLLMCLGRNWNPKTKYRKHFRSDGSEAPPIPDEFVRMFKHVVEVSELPSVSPDICLVNFYTPDCRLALRQECDESIESLDGDDLVPHPVVFISIGDSLDFMYGNRSDISAANFLLESGDILILVGESRLIYHGVKSIIPNSAPRSLLKQSLLRPGHLNLTFKKI